MVWWCLLTWLARSRYPGGAPGPLTARQIVVTDNDNGIVKPVIAPQSLGTHRVGMLHVTVVVAIANGIA